MVTKKRTKLTGKEVNEVVQEVTTSLGLCSPNTNQLKPGVFEPLPPRQYPTYQLDESPEATASRLKRNSNLFSYHTFRVKNSEQKDRGDFWEYVIVLTSYQSEIVLRHAVAKKWSQPNLPKVGETYVFDLFAEDPSIGGCESSSTEKSIPTLKPYRAED